MFRTLMTAAFYTTPEWSAFRDGTVYGSGRLSIQSPSLALWQWTVSQATITELPLPTSRKRDCVQVYYLAMCMMPLAALRYLYASRRKPI